MEGYNERLSTDSSGMVRVPSVSVENINAHVRDVNYAVRGPIVVRAGQLEASIKDGKQSGAFDHIVYCNIGNPQQVGQKPITYFRQILAICDYPELLESEAAASIFPADVRRVAGDIIKNVGGTGAYTGSKGHDYLRGMVADALTKRDGHKCNPDDLWLTDGASPGVHMLLKTVIRSENDGVLTPIPQYPLYSACMTLYGGTLVPYYLNEDDAWGLGVKELQGAMEKANANGINVRMLVVINPGNPTGQCLSVENQREVIQFCDDNNIMLVADEVYQENIYLEGQTFTSFKKVLRDMGDDYADFQLASLHSVSKGYYGECGRRGGVMEVCGISPEVHDVLYKLSSIGLCSNVPGQITMALVLNPPKPGDESYDTFTQEKEGILESLKRRAAKLSTAFNLLEGVTCNPSQGAMYVFPRLHLPGAAVTAANEMDVSPDFLYCMMLLEKTGVCVVPGAGFGQEPGTYHFRTTFLPAEKDIDEVIKRVSEFHKQFMDDFRD